VEFLRYLADLDLTVKWLSPPGSPDRAGDLYDLDLIPLATLSDGLPAPD
jgi:hypothetical protein